MKILKFLRYLWYFFLTVFHIPFKVNITAEQINAMIVHHGLQHILLAVEGDTQPHIIVDPLESNKIKYLIRDSSIRHYLLWSYNVEVGDKCKEFTLINFLRTFLCNVSVTDKEIYFFLIDGFCVYPKEFKKDSVITFNGKTVINERNANPISEITKAIIMLKEDIRKSF